MVATGDQTEGLNHITSHHITSYHIILYHTSKYKIGLENRKHDIQRSGKNGSRRGAPNVGVVVTILGAGRATLVSNGGPVARSMFKRNTKAIDEGG